MLSDTNVQGKKHQTGIALLILVVIIGIGSINYALSGFTIDSIEQDRKIKTLKALKQAKQALIAYAQTHAERAGEAGEIGFLPCPDVTNVSTEGNQDPNCAGIHENIFGLFPWKTLDIPTLRDGDGACLRYAVSGTYNLNTPSPMLNEDSFGMFQIRNAANLVVQGGQPEDRPVAIIFAPGKALPGQTRNFTANTICGEDYANEDAYLDEIKVAGVVIANNGVLSGVANDVESFVHATALSEDIVTTAIDTPYNDTFITITRNEIWPGIVARPDFQLKMQDLTQALAICLANYANANRDDNATPAVLTDDLGRRLPWPVETDVNGADYRVSANYSDIDKAATGFAGRYPYNVNESNLELGIGGAQELFNRGICGATAPLTNGNIVNLDNPADEFRKLWENWKDHFFYVLSDAYKPANASAVQACAGVDCVTVDGIPAIDPRAGIVLFSGNRTTNVIADTNIVTNYLEGVNATNYPDVTGNSAYALPLPAANDVMFCITNEAVTANLQVDNCQ